MFSFKMKYISILTWWQRTPNCNRSPMISRISQKMFCNIFLAFLLFFFSLFFYSGGGKGPQIAILHPRQLSVYSITKSPGKNKKSLDNFQITLIYAHKLSRSAFSMWSVGLLIFYFGGSKLV